MNVRIIIGLVSVVLISACSTVGPKFTEAKFEKPKAVIYIYRESNIFTSDRDAAIFINDKLISHLPNNSYVDILVNPGVYKLHYKMIGFDTDIIPPKYVDVQAGTERYMKLWSSGFNLLLYYHYVAGLDPEFVSSTQDYNSGNFHESFGRLEKINKQRAIDNIKNCDHFSSFDFSEIKI